MLSNFKSILFIKMKNILFVGHSILVRLFSFLLNNIDSRCKQDFNLREEFKIVKKCHSGLSFKKISRIYGGSIEKLFDNLVYEMTIIQLGGNDFERFQNRPIKMAKKLVKFAKSLKKIGQTKKIVICHLLPRSEGNKRYSLSYKKALKYRSWAKEVNYYLKIFASHKFIIWNHQQNFSTFRRSCFLNDGIHLSNHGNLLLYKSIRGAILYALNTS